MKQSLLTMIGLLLCSSITLAQDFTITGSTPGDGALSIDDTTQVTFTFSEAVDIDLMDPFDPGFLLIVFPFEAIELGDISLNGENTEMTIDVIHTQETNFVWTFYEAESQSGKALDEPYVMTYTTGSSLPSNSVSGSVSLSGEAGSPLTDVKGTVVYLFSSNPFIEDECEEGCEEGPDLDVVGGGLVNAETGDYMINYIGDGTYYPIGINLILDDFEDNPTLLAIYDPDDDGQFDTIDVSGTNVTGVDLTFQGFEGVTALVNLQAAIDTAAAINPNLDLYILGGNEIIIDVEGFDDGNGGGQEKLALAQEDGIDGLAQNWAYLFHSTVDDFTLLVEYGPFGTVVTDTLDEDELRDALDIDEGEAFSFDMIDPLPMTFIDSDSAAAVADANGGLDFLNTDIEGLSLLEIEYIASNADFIAPEIVTEGTFFWEVIYNREVLDPITFEFYDEELAVYIDLQTGAFLGSDLDTSEPILLKEGLDTVLDEATSRDPSNQLIFVNGFSVLERDLDLVFFKNDGTRPALEGLFRGYEYRFYSTDGDSVSSLFYDGDEAYVPDFEPFDFIPEPFTAADLAPIDTTGLIDSDVALTIAGENGGNAFLQSEFQGTDLVESSVSVQIGNFFWNYTGGLDENTIVYTVFYNRQSIDTGTFDFFSDGGDVVINALTGELISTSFPVSNEDELEIVDESRLLQNYPNPFNPTTNIPFELNRAQEIQLDVYNVLGQKVATLANGVFQSGLHTMSWDATSLSSGIYIYQLRTETSVLTRKLMLIK